MAAYNTAAPGDAAPRRQLLEELLGSIGEETEIRPPFYVDYGSRITIGARCFANFGLIALDVAPITIGDDVQIGPNVQLLTPTHPVEPGPRRDKWESAQPITIGDNVWLGGGVIVLPGVTIGADTVVGSRSSPDLSRPEFSPSATRRVLAVGNSAHEVVRPVVLRLAYDCDRPGRPDGRSARRSGRPSVPTSSR